MGFVRTVASLLGATGVEFSLTGTRTGSGFRLRRPCIAVSAGLCGAKPIVSERSEAEDTFTKTRTIPTKAITSPGRLTYFGISVGSSTVAQRATGRRSLRAPGMIISIGGTRRLAEPWTDEYQGLSSSLIKRATYSLGARGDHDLGELDRRVVLVTAGVDAGAHALYAEWVAWGVDPKTGQVLSWGLQYRIIGGCPDDDIEDPDLWREFDKALDADVWRHPAFPGALVPVQRVLGGLWLPGGRGSDMVRGAI